MVIKPPLFRVSCPIGIAADARGLETPAELAHLGILVVDDDPLAIKLMRRMLPDYPGFRFATSATDALRVVHAAPPDLILLDGEMPDQNGFELCAILKADPRTSHIPIIFVTAHDDAAFETRALALGAADFLTKPLSRARLRLRVKLHLQLKHQLDTLRSLATTDAATGVANRRRIDEVLAAEWARAERASQPLSLLLVDVDHFKAYNDTYGHPAGDRCLRQLAGLIAEGARRPQDLAGRFGGEEFAVVLPHTDAAGAQRVAEAIRGRVEAAAIPHAGSATAGHVTVSIGGAIAEPSAPSGDRTQRAPARDALHGLVEPADRALYAAKRRGRNRIELAALTADA